MMLTNRRSFVLLLCLVAVLITTRPIAGRFAPGDADFEPTGLQRQRSYFSQFPFEVVDVVNGNLTLRMTDLVLPGDAGMNLAIVRRYQHKSRLDINTPRWEIGIGGIPSMVLNPDEPAQINCQPSGICDYPILDGIDGQQKMFSETGLTNSAYYVSAKFWRYHRATHTLELPNGWIATYNESGVPYEAKRLSEVHDVYGNSIAVEWEDVPGGGNRRLHAITHHVQSGTREITFAYDNSATTMPVEMTFDNRTWHYGYVGNALENRMSHASPPAGSGWAFEYGGTGLDEWIEATTPAGGVVRYEFSNQELPLNSGTQRLVLRTRRIGNDAWGFTYDHQINNPVNGTDDVLISDVTLPDGRSLHFESDAGWGGGGNASQDFGPAWKLRSKTIKRGGAQVSRLERDYTKLAVTSTAYVYEPLEDRVIQDGLTFKTVLTYDGSNFADYHHPKEVDEFVDGGSTHRLTTRTFDYNFSPRILGAVSSETVAVTGGGAFTTSYDYADGTGFLEGQTVHGTSTTFSPDARGNRASMTDANNHTTGYSYEWGALKNSATPEYTISRSINVDGTVASETRRGLTTQFTYDGAGRVVTVTPPGNAGDATTTSYASNGSSVTVTRGGSWTRTDLDGFGRPIGTENVVGVKTTIEYDTDGRKTFQSYPYGGGVIGDSFQYDDVNRVKKITRQGGAQVNYAYSGTDVSIASENNHTTVQHWQAFGDPSDGRLVGITDAKNEEWSYSYNAAGSLTRVDGPNNVDRVWNYDGTTNRLSSETQPESGNSSYGYDNVGNMTSKSAAGIGYEYGYDANNRLLFIKVNVSTKLDINYDDSDNRTFVQTESVTSTFGYDDGNRMTSRQDAITNGPTYTTGFSYDGRDNLTRIDYPSTRAICSDYDNGNRITQVKTCGGAAFASNISYDASGAISFYDAGNGTWESIAFDARLRPTTLKSFRAVNNMIQDLHYEYDDVGNVTYQGNDVDGTKSMGFSYDQLDRLIGGSGLGSAVMEYDPVGNRTRHGSTYFSYDANQRLESLTGGVTTFQYDGAGNMKRDADGSTYDYDGLNQMRQATIVQQSGPPLVTAYGYDGDNQRVIKSNNTGEHYYVHGPGGLLLADYRAGVSTPEREYVYIGSRLLASIGRPTPAQPALTVSISTPDATVAFGANVALTATLNLGGMSVTRVEFWQGGKFISSDALGPSYTATWNNLPLPAGQYTFTARVVAVDAGSITRSATSAPITITVSPPAPVPDGSVSPPSRPPLLDVGDRDQRERGGVR